MKPPPSNIPEPRTREEVMALLWPFLKERLRVRMANGGLGNPTLITHRMPGANGYEENFNWHADVPVGGDGSIILAALMKVYPGHLRASQTTLSTVLEVVYDLERQGVLRNSGDRGVHGMYITSHGARLLETTEVDLPAGSAERVVRLKAEFAALPSIDLIARHYAEATAAYAANLNYSGAVMIGVCFEAGILVVARAIARCDARSPGTLVGLNKNHKKVLPAVLNEDYVAASALEDLVYDVLCAMPSLDQHDADWVRKGFRPISLFVRSLRNLAGHPTGKEVSRDDVAAHISTLPAFLRRVASITGQVERLP